MKYEKPIIILNDDLAEGVYAASGCYTVATCITQIPQIGRGDYRIQLDAIHDADHTNNAQKLTITFNQNVKYVSSNGELEFGDNTTTLVINFGYFQNEYDKVGLGELVVTADEGLDVIQVLLTD